MTQNGGGGVQDWFQHEIIVSGGKRKSEDIFASYPAGLLAAFTGNNDCSFVPFTIRL